MSIDPASRPLGPIGPEAPDDEAPAAADAAWQARLEAVNRGPGEPTALERHVLFFDANKDGTLSVKEVRRGLERLGMDSWMERVFASTLNNVLLGPPTRDRLITFKIDIANIEKARHEGDTGIFDAEGHFVPAKFEEMWARFDKDRDGRLTATELRAMVAENVANVGPGRAKFSAEAEFDLMLKLCAYEDEKGERYMTRERMLAFYDGSLFEAMAAEVKLFGKVVRHPIHAESSFGAPGVLADVARRDAGPAAGPAAGAAYGDALLAAETAGTSAAGMAALGGMMAVCPYAGAMAGAQGAGPR